MVRAAGYGYACAVGPGDLAGPHALPRTYIGDKDSAPRLYAKWVRHGLRSRRAPGSSAGFTTAGGAR
jgi:hypothetical protein